jgi:mRNA interferase HicA
MWSRGEDVKQKELVKLLKNNGWRKLRDTGPHTVYTDGKHIEPIPRHKEIKETLAKAIIKRRGLK